MPNVDATSVVVPAAPAATLTPLDGPSWLQRRLCGECFARRDAERRAAAEAAATADNVVAVPETVETLLKLALGAVEDERERGRALDTKTASLAGFTGLVLSVNVTLGRPLLESDLGGVGSTLAVLFFALSVVCLTAALALAVFGVLMPQKHRGLGLKQLRMFSSPSVQARSRQSVQQSMLESCADMVDQDRPVNDCKAKITTRVGWALLLGFAGVAGQAHTLAAHDLGI